MGMLHGCLSGCVGIGIQQRLLQEFAGLHRDTMRVTASFLGVEVGRVFMCCLQLTGCVKALTEVCCYGT